MLSADNWVCSRLKADLLSAKEKIRSSVVRGTQSSYLRNYKAVTAKSKDL